MAAPVYTYTFTNGSTIDATQLMQNFNDILNGVTNATKDLSFNKLTLAGNIALTTNAAQDIGTATIGVKGVYIGGTSSFTTYIQSAATASWTFTLPVTAGSSGNYLNNTGSGSTSWLAFTAPTVTTLTSTGTQTGTLFTVSGVTTAPTNGATYTNNGHTYTVATTSADKLSIWTVGAGATSGTTLTKSGGTGDSTITFSAASSLATYTPPSTAKAAWIRALGGGGAGGGAASAASSSGAGAGGGGGGYSEKLWASPTAMLYAIGAGGTQGTAGNNPGNSGGNTSIVDIATGAVLLFGGGGSGGGGSGSGSSVSMGGTGADGGTASGGDVNLQGAPGGNGYIFTGSICASGNGGQSMLGDGSRGIVSSNSAGRTGQNYGSGGSGGAQVSAGGAQQGGAGASGVIIIHEFYNGN